MSRRALAQPLLVALALSAAAAGGCGRGGADGSAKKVIVLGFDGMDYTLTKQMMDAGRLPHFRRLAEMGTFAPLETSIPPQSPVAWSNFITGMDAGGHGIFDFVHRDPTTMLPYLSTSSTAPGRSLRLGTWQIPLSGGKVEHPYMGVSYQMLDSQVAADLNISATDGAVVMSVESGSAAEKAGLQEKDVIVALDGQKVDADHSLMSALFTHKPGDKVNLTVMRNGKQVQVTLTLGVRPATQVDSNSGNG